MKRRAGKSVTLVELLISIVLIGLVILGLSNIEIFCRTQLLSSDRRLKVQSEASFVIEHMAKHILNAVNKPGADAVVFPTTGRSYRVRVDSNRNGVFDDSGSTDPDSYIVYRYDANARVLQYCANMSLNQALNVDGNCINNAWETLSAHITSSMGQPDILYNNSTNYLDITVSTCWDVDGNPVPCGLRDNPSVSMQSRCIMPSVSTR